MKNGIPFWFDGVEAPAYPPLDEDLDVDVAIVGGGQVGLHCAYKLKDSGLRVVVLEARRIGRQATGRSTAKVTVQHGRRYSTLISKYGEGDARIYAEANKEAMEEIARLAAAMEEQAGLDVRAAFIYAADENQARMLEEEAQAARSLGLPARMVFDAGLPFATTALLEFSGQYQFDPYRYLVGLAPLINAPIYEQSRVTEIEGESPRRLKVNGHTVAANHVIVATQMPIVNEGRYFAKAFPFAHPVVAAPLPADKPLEGMFINAGSPSHSLRTAERDGQTYLIAAGGEYKQGEEEDQQRMMDDLRTFLEKEFGIRTLSHAWTNEDFRPMDGVAFVGPASSDGTLQVATGFDAWGITQGVVAADILAGHVIGRSHPASRLFDAARMRPVKSAREFTKGNIEAATHLVRDKMLKRMAVPLDDIAPGSAGIVDHNGEQLAVIRHMDGSLTAFTASCTHMGCIIGWNPIDRTWDCPCHGSRFDEHGDVIAGPAVSPLKFRLLEGIEDEGA
ncbi:FAD-dependent oxidoreductase [Chelativorans sp. Marseille-P2723]|uniref:FAD-dependent oxidoreductase n=1 Tax=Chelativorans sp. Marseille-P2723 TaxID=2709133 RepID=UPI00156D8965|nr:FAD-dependent oxidoreductase [Chelativorans sp. Marseille-P2723]